jgi:hypothetical protein
VVTFVSSSWKDNALVSATSARTTLETMPPFVSFRCARQLPLAAIKKAKMPTIELVTKTVLNS